MKNIFLENKYKGVSGITVIDSGVKGENIGIFAITHGNEPVGLDVFNFLVKDFEIQKKIISGKIFLIAINIEAYKKYLEKGDFNSFRFIDHNMNRIQGKKFEKNSSEFIRLEELEKIFEEIDIAIDLHSVPIGDDVIGISDKNFLGTAKKFFDVEKILVDDMSKQSAVISYFIKNNKEAYGLECGNHISGNSFENGKKNILNFLILKNKIFGKIILKNKNNKIFEFIEEVKVKTDNFIYSKKFKGFTRIKDGEIFATDGGKNISHNLGENIYLGIVMKNTKKGDGAGFLFKKILQNQKV